MRRLGVVLVLAVLGWGCSGSAHAADWFYDDTWSTPHGRINFVSTPDSNNWTTVILTYTAPCPVPYIFQGFEVPDLAGQDTWSGQAGWWQRKNGSCTGESTSEATLTATGPNTLRICSVDPFGQLGRVCENWNRTAPRPAGLPRIPANAQNHEKDYYVLVIDENGVPHMVPRDTGGPSSVATGWYGDSVVLAAEGITGGTPAQALFAAHAPCHRQLDQLVGSQAKAVTTVLAVSRRGHSSRSQRYALAGRLDSQARLAPVLGRCLSEHHYGGSISPQDASDAQTSMYTGQLPQVVSAAFRRAGATQASLEVVRLGLRTSTVGELRGKLVTKLQSRAAARSLHRLARMLRH